MKNMKRTLLILVAILMIITLLCSCNRNDQPNDKYTDSGSDNASLNPDESCDTDPLPVTDIEILTDGKLNYDIVVSADPTLSSKKSALKLTDYLFINFGIVAKTVNDTDKEITDKKAKEILVGKTNRAESFSASEGLKLKDYVVKYDQASDRIIIGGGSEDAIAEGVKYFCNTFSDIENKKITVKSNLNDSCKYEYPIGNVKIDENDLSEYIIVVPKDTDLFTYYAGVNLSEYIEKRVGLKLEVVDDSTAETEKEILIGMTNRKASKDVSSVVIKDGDFLLKQDGNKIVMLGNDYMAGGAASEFANNYMTPENKGDDVNINDLPKDNKTKTFEFKKAKNAILMIGDGMGFNHIEMALASGLDAFVARALPNCGSCLTYSQSVTNGSAGYTDSAAAATALSAGIKTINNYVGMDPKGKAVTNIREIAQSKGARTAVITTDVITGATPAGFLCHNISRKNTAQLKNEIEKLQSEGKVDYCAGSLGNALQNTASKAANIISQDDAPFFMMIEEAYIDKNSHNNKAAETVEAVIRFNNTISYIIEFTVMHPDTVLIITADHETGGIVKGSDGKYSYTTKNHTNSDVPVYALGYGTEFIKDAKINNIDIPRFLGKIFGEAAFGNGKDY